MLILCIFQATTLFGRGTALLDEFQKPQCLFSFHFPGGVPTIRSAEHRASPGLYSEEPPAKSPVHWGRAIWQEAAFTAVIGIIYRLDLRTNKPDWVFSLTWHDQIGRLWVTKWIFDANDFLVNFRHVPQGLYNHLIARSNGLNLLESFLFEFGSSFLWEAAVEYHEEISLNDMIHTPWTGFVLGENFFLLGEFFRSRDLGAVGKVLSWLFDPLSRLNRPDKKAPDGASPPRSYDSRVAASLLAGAGRTVPAEALAPSFAFEWSDRFLPSAGESLEKSPGGTLRRPLGSDLDSRFALYSDGRMEISLASHILVAGHVSPDRIFSGLGSALEFVWSDRAGWTDRLLAADLAGFAGGLVLDRPSFRLEAEAGAYWHFSMVRPAALETFLQSRNLDGAKTTLRLREYYFAWGPTLEIRSLCRFSIFELAGQFRFRDFISIEGRERYPDTVTRDFKLTDTRTNWRLSLGIAVAPRQALVFVAAEGLHRWGRMDTISAARDLIEYKAGVSLFF